MVCAVSKPERFYQFSLFDDLLAKTTALAINCLSRDSVYVEELEPWMLKLVPDGIFAAQYGGHRLVLKKKETENIPVGYEYCHYLINGAVYVGIYVS